MGRQGRYPAEVRERAVRLVFEQQEAHESQWAAIESIAGKMGCTAETLRKWVRRAERDAGARARGSRRPSVNGSRSSSARTES
jgi:transposase